MEVKGHPMMPSNAKVEIFLLSFFISVKVMLYHILLVIENSKWRELTAWDLEL